MQGAEHNLVVKAGSGGRGQSDDTMPEMENRGRKIDLQAETNVSMAEQKGEQTGSGDDSHDQHHHHQHHAHYRPVHRKKSSTRLHARLPGTSSSEGVLPKTENPPVHGPPSSATVENHAQVGHLNIVEQLMDWVKQERQRQKEWRNQREARRAARREEKARARTHAREDAHEAGPSRTIPGPAKTMQDDGGDTLLHVPGDENQRPATADSSGTASTGSTITGGFVASTTSLDNLERIIQQAAATASTSSIESVASAFILKAAEEATQTESGHHEQPHQQHHDPPHHHQAKGDPNHTPSKHKKKALRPPNWPPTVHSGAASDTDVGFDGEVNVPSCEVTLGIPEKIGWDEFKSEVLKLTHTLRCKGWRSVGLDRFRELKIERISGALTNAVYMVVPPEEVPPPHHGSVASSSTRTPSKLLLRIYGSQVGFLINRDLELSILRRLARRKIGPRLLGTFENGRFEQFFNAQTLTKDNIRHPETSRQIARRMRELHEGVELLEEELKAGPVMWVNWDKWVQKAREIMQDVDADASRKMERSLRRAKTASSGEHERREEGKRLVCEEYVCGIPWERFEWAVGKYRKWLLEQGGGEDGVRSEMVFAHNDTQYGNILRMNSPTSAANTLLPVAQPTISHRQLIVIDFEYASASPRGFELANHFCEWMANYHDPDRPWELKAERFPTPQEVERFVASYVDKGRDLGAYETEDGLRVGGGEGGEEELRKEVRRLMRQATIWRPASHAMWAAWGIVQAKVPQGNPPGSPDSEKSADQEEKMEDGEAEFDYLKYAQQRVRFFWGDMLELGVLTEQEIFEGVFVPEKGAVFGEWVKRVVEYSRVE